jgi:predicted acyl esterase
MMSMSQLQPPSLKAIIPLFTDTDSYRDYLYNGGLWNKFNRGSNRSPASQPKEVVDGLTKAMGKRFTTRLYMVPMDIFTSAPTLIK